MILPLLLALSAAASDPRPAIEKDRSETREALRSAPDSYLAAIARKDFGDKHALTAGSAQDNDVRLEGLAAHHLRVTLQGERFRVDAVDGGAAFFVGKSSAAAPVREAAIGPSALRAGRYLLRLSHQGYPAIIVFDPKSPRFKEYHGIEYFPIDLSYRYVVPLEPDASQEPIALKSSHSADRRARRAGWFSFSAGGKKCRLAAYRLQEPGVDADALSVFFRDATTGKESYSVGRYVDPEKQADGKYVLDFNMAYNPACAYSPFYNCPIPPRENELPVAIRAGERDSRYHR